MFSDGEEFEQDEGRYARGGRDLSRSRSREHSGEGKGGRPDMGNQLDSLLKGKSDGKGDKKGKGKGRGPKTSGTEIPEMGTIHRGSVASIQSFGCFVRIEDGSKYKDGLLHISCISATRIEKVEDVLSQGENIWVKVCNVKEEEGKYSVDMRYVSQKDGKDLDPNNINGPVPQGGGKDSNFKPIELGAIHNTVCTKCGSHGHLARECWAGTGAKYELVTEAPGPGSVDKKASKDAKKKAKEIKKAEKKLKKLQKKVAKKEKKKVKKEEKKIKKKEAKGENKKAKKDCSSSSSSDDDSS